VIVERVSGAR